MNKEELKQYIKNMSLEKALEKMLFDLIDQAPEVNKKLVDGIADIIDLQSDFYEQSADLLEESADMYEGLSAEMKTIDEEENAEQMQAIFENQKSLLDDLNNKMGELTTHQENQQTSQQINQLQQQIQQMSGPAVAQPQQVVQPTLQPDMSAAPIMPIPTPQIPPNPMAYPEQQSQQPVTVTDPATLQPVNS